MSEVLPTRRLTNLDAFRKDAVWYRRNHKTLKNKHAGMYVAIRGMRVVAEDKDLGALLTRLKKKYGSVGSIVVKFIGTRKVYPTV